MKRIYLDHAATTPVLPAAAEAMADALRYWANPSSPHADGRRARTLLDDARRRIAAALDWNGDIVFTASASEAARLAFRRCHMVGPKPAISSVEHDAVIAQAREEDRLNLPVGSSGILDPEGLANWLKLAPGGLVAVQQANSETGIIQPLDQIGEAIDAAGSYLLADCAQSAGKLALPNADLIILSGHKLGAPPGVGALLVRDAKLLVPEGGQERGLRRGTENVPAIVALAAALETRAWDMVRLASMRTELDARLTAAGATIIGEGAPRIATIGAYAMPGVSASAQVVQFDAIGISVSAGSACSSGSMKTSRILGAMGVDPAAADSTIRVSFGWNTTTDDVTAFADAWETLARRARKAA